METIILGDGPMGWAIADGLRTAGLPARAPLGRPVEGPHPPLAFAGADVVFEASRGGAVAKNVEAGVAGGCRRFVIATTGWDRDRAGVDRLLRERRATAVTAANFSIGVAAFLRLVDEAVRLLGPLPEFDPYLVEWHRRSKADRPSGTAKELLRRVLAAHPRKRRLADPAVEGPPRDDELALAVVRAGASPGMHLVGFDAPGETIELRVTARDRSAYAAGAIAAGRWLVGGSPPPGIHQFDDVIADLLSARAPLAVPA
jgi:4-hydroxy-tetrahydrodipicolinate reductase